MKITALSIEDDVRRALEKIYNDYQTTTLNKILEEEFSAKITRPGVAIVRYLDKSGRKSRK